MANSSTGDNQEVTHHLIEKKEELIWALSLQGYSYADICIIFGIKHRAQAMRIVERMPRGWKPKWVKSEPR